TPLGCGQFAAIPIVSAGKIGCRVQDWKHSSGWTAPGCRMQMSGSTPLSNRRTIPRTFRNRVRDARLARQVSSEVESLESRLLLSTATFSGPGVYPVRPFTKIITLADFNGDGKPDIAGAVSQGGGAVVTLLNNGNGTFSQPFYFAAGIPRSIASADFNHDGKIDLAVAGG